MASSRESRGQPAIGHSINLTQLRLTEIPQGLSATAISHPAEYAVEMKQSVMIFLLPVEAYGGEELSFDRSEGGAQAIAVLPVEQNDERENRGTVK